MSIPLSTTRANRNSRHPAEIIQRAQIDPLSLTHADIMQLQRTIGNRAVGRLFGSIHGGAVQRAISGVPVIQRAAHRIQYNQPRVEIGEQRASHKKNHLYGNDTIAVFKHDRGKFKNPPAGMDRTKAKKDSGWTSVPEPGAKCNHSRSYTNTKNTMLGRFIGKTVDNVVRAIYVFAKLLGVDPPDSRPKGTGIKNDFGKRATVSNWMHEGIARICNRDDNLFFWPAARLDDESDDDWAVDYDPDTVDSGWQEDNWDQTDEGERGEKMRWVNDRLEKSRNKIDSIM